MSPPDDDNPPAVPRRAAPLEQPVLLRLTVNFMFALLGIGVVSFVVDLVAGSIATNKLTEAYESQGYDVTSVPSFNPGTMFSNLSFALFIGAMAVLVARGGHGARVMAIAGTVPFMCGGVGGIIVGMVSTGAANYHTRQFLGEFAVSSWYEVTVVVLGIAQFSLGLTVTIQLFDRSTVAYCKAHKR